MKMLTVFHKGMRLRHIGHLDLMRAMQRALRRSDLPLCYSQGFNPHILLSFAAPLSVGMPGLREVMEVPLSQAVSEEQFLSVMNAALPPDLKCLEARAVDDRHPSPMAQLRSASYVFHFSEPADTLVAALPAFLERTSIPAVRKTKSGDRQTDIRPMIHSLKAENGSLYAVLSLCEAATCKPDLLLSSLCEFSNTARPRCIVTREQLYGEGGVPLEAL